MLVFAILFVTGCLINVPAIWIVAGPVALGFASKLSQWQTDRQVSNVLGLMIAFGVAFSVLGRAIVNEIFPGRFFEYDPQGGAYTGETMESRVELGLRTTIAFLALVSSQIIYFQWRELAG